MINANELFTTVEFNETDGIEYSILTVADKEQHDILTIEFTPAGPAIDEHQSGLHIIFDDSDEELDLPSLLITDSNDVEVVRYGETIAGQVVSGNHLTVYDYRNAE